MIRYALNCENDHGFEAWFGSSSDYDDQAARGLVECPFCASRQVAKQIMAPAQGGEHEDGRKTWGRSMIVGPWGEVIARAEGDEPCVLMADLDMEAVDRARRAVPQLTHDRDFDPPASRP